jgi:hypothetical protein
MGGETEGTGIKIRWQRGPLGRGEEKQDPNGAFVEGVIQAAIDRLQHYQAGKFRCNENGRAIMHLERALEELDNRTAEREGRQVEGTHQL